VPTHAIARTPETSTTAAAHCSHIGSCELFPKFQKRPSLGVWQTFYCKGRFTTCARYRLSLEGKPVPPSLLPNGKELNLVSLGL